MTDVETRRFPDAQALSSEETIISIVGIGASAGGLTAIEKLLAGLPADFRLPVLIVLHIGSHASQFPSLFARHSALPCRYAEDGEAVQGGRIYVAPPGCHMLVKQDRIHLTRGPRENWARPSIDVLFRSLAWQYSEGAIGIILTGGLNDGTAGLYELKRRGGIAIVQDPAEAELASMPKSALDNVKVDYCLPLTQIPKCLVEISRKRGNQNLQGTRKEVQQWK